LGGAYDIEKRVAIRLPGYPQEELKEVLRAYLAVRRLDPTGERVLVRTFQLRSPNVLTAQLMGFMWDRERRALATLSPTTAGKALLGFREARRIEDQHVALLVTEWPGTETLRSLLHGNPHPSLRQQKGRVDFWRQFTPILNAIDALHGSGFLHRSLSPEAIYDQSVQQNDSAAIPLSSTLRLCHFEWSVYLRGLGGLGKYRRQALNRYVAPEALRAALAISSGQRGETFGSDLYALGLTLFECMIRPFRGEEELRLYSSPEAYDEAEQEAHRAWLQALRTEVRAAHRNGTIESFERDLLLGDGRRFGLLEFEVAQRLATLAPIVAVIHEFALRAQFDINEPLPVFTTLSTRHSDPRADLRCIAYYLARYLPEVDTASDLSAIALARIITNDLRGASVFINREPRSPLLLRSRTGTMYRLKTFSWDGQERHDVAYLEMARHWEGDEPAGDVIGTLHESVKVHDIDMGSAAIYRFLGAHREKAWVDFFSLALEWKPAMVQESQSRDRRAQLVDVLGLSTEVDYELAWNEAQFVRVGNGLQIRAPAGEKKNLAVLVSTWLSRDLRLEVTRLRVPFGEGIEIGLGLESLDIEAGTVDLSGEISADLLPQEGVLRPSGNRGISALYRRRKEVLRQLREDTVLLDSAVDPSDGVRELAKDAFGHVEFSLPQLDGEKRRIVEAYRRVRPLLVVQGPPGTGKTTLATEVILQTLAEASNTRVLIASQGHAPLDNLLERLLTEKDRNSAAKQKLERAEIVRLPSGNRRAQDYPERVREHLPYERADRLFRELRRDSAKNQNALGLTGVVARSVLDALKPFQSAPNSLRRRIEESANLVFVTTSAREIETAIPGSFDFVIVEEAARCAPIELLGVMRLARHWLLIGDHQQLPPFGFEMTVGAVDRRLEALILDAENGQSQKLTQSDSRVDTEGTRLRAIQRNAPTYMELFKHLHASGGAKAAMTLRTQWRMHPALGSMISDVFYDSLAVTNPIGSDLQGLIKRTTHPFREPSFLRNQQLIWIDFDSAVDDPACGESRGAGGELENSAERRTLVAFLRQLQSDRPSHDLAVLTPYRRQAEQLRGLLSERYNRFDAFGTIEDRIATVDSFQGRQAGTVILSLVRNNNLVHHRSSVGFLSESQRATVMFSRSERLLVILGCSAHFKRFQETSWMMEIYDRAYHIDWKNILPSAERRKLERCIRAEGLVYAVEIRTGSDDLDWLDDLILKITDQPQKLAELFPALPLPWRFIENALSRLLERNLLLVDVHEGTVRASKLPYVPARGQETTSLIWQDHATGILLPLEHVKAWESPIANRQNEPSVYRIRGGPPRRTPLEMSDAELLHHMQRFLPEIESGAEITSKERVRRMTLDVRGAEREDGRLAIKDGLPWPLRAAWVRLPDSRAVSDETDEGQFSLPPRWEDAVGRWLQESYGRITGSDGSQRAAAPMLRMLESQLSTRLDLDGVALTKRLAREAQSSVIVTVSGEYATVGEAIQILLSAPANCERILVVGSKERLAKRDEWERQAIRVVIANQPISAECIMIDGGLLLFGGMSSSSAKVITMRSNGPLDAYVAWFAGLGVSLRREKALGDRSLIGDVKSFERDILDLPADVDVPTPGKHGESLEDDDAELRVRLHLRERWGILEAKLIQNSLIPFSWLSLAEVLALVARWNDAIRVVTRSSTSLLAATALGRGRECAQWLVGDAPADCVILDRIVVLGFATTGHDSLGPDFVAINDPDLASQLRIETSHLPQLTVAI